MRKAFFILTLPVLVTVNAQAAMTWRASPEIATEQAHGGHSHRGPLEFYLREGAGAEVLLLTPDLAARPLAVQGEKAVVKPTGAEGYHMLLARRQLPGEEQVTARYFFLPGKPSGHSPSELLAAQISELEIVPAPLPREHWRYESSEEAVFQLRFSGAPLGGAAVRMITSNGTLLEAESDAQGMVRFGLPEDFAQVGAGREANAPGDFVVSAEHEAGGTRYVTTLNANYSVNPAHWQSTLGGGLSLAAGFLVGIVVLRPRKEQKA